MYATLHRHFVYYPIVAMKGEKVWRYLRDYRKSQYWPQVQLEQYQKDCLKRLISHAVTASSYYRRLFDCRLGGVAPSLRDFPLLEKDKVADPNSGLIVRKGLFDSRKTTGGSTGVPVSIWKSADALARERAITWRGYEWAGVSVGDPQARIWGVPIAAPTRWKYKLADFAANRIRLSAFDLTPRTLSVYHGAIVRFRPRYIYGYVSAVREFASHCATYGLEIPTSVRAIITTSEVLTDDIRKEIARDTGVRVFNEYGCGEVGSIAHECDAGQLHLSSENLLVESLPVDGGQRELIVTDLHNYAMPLIRYRVGDFGELSADQCLCGKSLPTLKRVHGRAYDFLRMSSGRLVHPELLIYVFEEMKEEQYDISQFQVVQTASDAITVNLVVGPNWNADSGESRIHAGIGKTLGKAMKVSVDYVASIERESSGKLRLVKRVF